MHQNYRLNINFLGKITSLHSSHQTTTAAIKTMYATGEWWCRVQLWGSDSYPPFSAHTIIDSIRDASLLSLFCSIYFLSRQFDIPYQILRRQFPKMDPFFYSLYLTDPLRLKVKKFFKYTLIWKLNCSNKNWKNNWDISGYFLNVCISVTHAAWDGGECNI